MTTEGELAARMDALITETQKLRAELAIENQKRDKRIATNRVLTVVTIVAVIAAIALGYKGVRATQDANESRAARTVASCVQYNRQQDEAIAADHDRAMALATTFRAAVASNPNADEKAVNKFLADLVRDQDAASRAGHPHRDCSPAGIKRYFETVPTTQGG